MNTPTVRDGFPEGDLYTMDILATAFADMSRALESGGDTFRALADAASAAAFALTEFLDRFDEAQAVDRGAQDRTGWTDADKTDQDARDADDERDVPR